jgi:hypothetical protein
VGDVDAVKTLAPLDQGFGPQHLLDRRELDGPVEDARGGGVLEPFFVDAGQAVAGAVDDVDEVLAAVRLAEPVREGHVGRVARIGRRTKGGLEVVGADKDVEVLGVTLYAGVAGERIGAADQDVRARTLERIQGAAVEDLFVRVDGDLRLSRHRYREMTGSRRRAATTRERTPPGAEWGALMSGHGELRRRRSAHVGGELWAPRLAPAFGVGPRRWRPLAGVDVAFGRRLRLMVRDDIGWARRLRLLAPLE